MLDFIQNFKDHELTSDNKFMSVQGTKVLVSAYNRILVCILPRYFLVNWH